MSLYDETVQKWTDEALFGADSGAVWSWAYAASMLAKAEHRGTEGPTMLLGTLPGGFTFGVIRRVTPDGVRWEVHS